MSHEIIDVEVEEIPQDQQQNGLMKIDFSRLPIKLSVTDLEIARVSEYKNLTIKDVNDKAGYNVVDIRRKEVKKLRTNLKTHAEELRKPAITFRDKVIAEEKRLTDLLKEIETNLEEKQKVIDDEVERIRLEEEKKAQEKLQARVNELAQFGVTDLHLAYLRSLPDADYQDTLSRAKEAWEIAEDAKRMAAEEKRLAEETAQKQQEENERLKRELDEANKKITQQQPTPQPQPISRPVMKVPVTTHVTVQQPPNTDKQKLTKLFEDLSGLQIPQFDDPEIKEMVYDATGHIGNAVQIIKKAINTLNK